MKLTHYIYDGFHNFIVRFYPFLSCMAGGIFLQLGSMTDGWGPFIGAMAASAAWIFALDLARSHAIAKTRSEVALQFISKLTDGNDTEISIGIHHYEKVSPNA